jgi:hypothetical protein
MNVKSMAAWHAAYAKADTLYTTFECGCLAVVLTDMPDNIRASKAEIMREALAGRAFKRLPRVNGHVDLPPLNCPTHEAEQRARHDYEEDARANSVSNRNIIEPMDEASE